jgi:hypothetical protein
MAIFNVFRGLGSVVLLFGKVALCLVLAVGDRLHAAPSRSVDLITSDQPI